MCCNSLSYYYGPQRAYSVYTPRHITGWSRKSKLCHYCYNFVYCQPTL